MYPVPPPRQPFLDPYGNMTREWWLFFSRLYADVQEGMTNGDDEDGGTLDLFGASAAYQEPGGDEPQQPQERENADDYADVRALAESALQTAKEALSLLPIGMVVSWDRPVSEIPRGWQLADGTNGTRNLIDRVLIGATNTYAIGATGGATTDTSSGPSATTVVDTNGDGTTASVGSSTHTHQVDILPPYTALCFIQRVA